MSTIRTSVLWSAADRYAVQILTVLTTAIMARILTPAETGVYLVANALILLADNLRGFGISVYLVQERDLTRRMIRSGFTLMLAVSLATGLGILALAGKAAHFYGEPALAGLLRVAALSFLVVPFSGTIVALLQRDFAFGRLAIINVSAIVANSAVTIGLGLLGMGPVSFVWGFVAAGFVTTALALRARPDFGIFRPAWADMRGFVAFGAISSSVTLLNMAYDMLPRLAFGKMLGFDAVGLFARAITICQLPDRAITQAMQPVVLPAMAARTRDGGSLKEAYLRGHALMSAIQWPTFAMIAVMADPVVRVLLGAQWDAVPPLVRTISLAMMALSPAFMTYPVLVATGRIRDTLVSSLISIPPSAAIIIGAATLGLQAVAASLLILMPFQMFVSLCFVRRAIGLQWREVAEASRRSVIVTLGTVSMPVVLLLALSPDGYHLSWPAAGVVLLAAASGWFATLHLSAHPLAREITAICHMLRPPAIRRVAVTADGKGPQPL